EAASHRCQGACRDRLDSRCRHRAARDHHLAMEVSNVASTLTLLSAQVKEVQGRTVETQIGQERNGQVSARVIFDVPWNDAAVLAEKFKNAGQVRVHQVTRDPQAPEGKLAIG